MMLVTEVTAFDAGVSLVHWVVEHTANGNHTIRGDIHIDVDGATRMTETTERTPCLNRCLRLHRATPVSDERDGNRVTPQHTTWRPLRPVLGRSILEDDLADDP